ncbi:MAG TPA: AAA family ATPase [Gemmataceae bacterium]|jgi:Holliday junction DNA helicase RuvB
MRRVKPFHGFIGQRQLVKCLTSWADGSQAQGKPLPHLLFAGPTGFGKTKLAQALAAYLGTDCSVLHGKCSPAKLCASLANLRKGDILLIDECHALPESTQELLYTVLDDKGWVEDHLGANAPNAKRTAEQKLMVEPITLILATNKVNKLEAALKRRPILVMFNDYTLRELIAIVKQEATREKILFTAQAARLVAEVSHGRPYQVKKHLQQMSLMSYDASQEIRRMSEDDVRRYLRKSGIGTDGLDSKQWDYLAFLADQGCVSLTTVAMRIGLDPATTREWIEYPLVYMRLVSIDRAGRRLTDRGERYVKERREQQARKIAITAKETAHEN